MKPISFKFKVLMRSSFPMLASLFLTSCATGPRRRMEPPPVKVSAREEPPDPLESTTPAPTLDSSLDWEKLFDRKDRSKSAMVQLSPMPVAKALQILGQMGGLNIVASSKVASQRLDFPLKSLAPKEALRIILKSNDLEALVLASDTLLVVPAPDASKFNLQKNLVYRPNSGTPQAYLSALTLTNPSLGAFADDQLGVLVLTGSTSAITAGMRLLAELDRDQDQVTIELKVAEITHSKKRKVGLESTGSGAYTTPLEKLRVPTLLNFTDFPAVIDWRGEKSVARLLANPSITVLNKKKAVITIGDRIPLEVEISSIVQGQVAISKAIQFESIGITLDIQPTIQKAGEVMLVLDAEVSAVVKTTQAGFPQIGTRRAQTTLRLQSGETTVIGGLIREEIQHTRVGVPFLVEIPILGLLFGVSTHDTLRSELVISITPTIVPKNKI